MKDKCFFNIFNISKTVILISTIGSIFAHGVSKETANAMIDASLLDYLIFGAEHMITGYDHILFLVGVIFFLTNYWDIIKFVSAFTIGHSITLIFATSFGITANAYLIDAVIAFSVIYKGFENLDGFKHWFSSSAPNLILMVFIFGLIHGFGLSTKLQELPLEDHLNIKQILSFNVGVELGQIAALMIIFPLLLLIRGELFKIISKIVNWILVGLGIILLIYQLDGYYTSEIHHYEIHEFQGEKNKNNDEEHSHDHEEHSHDHEEHSHDHEEHSHDHEEHSHDHDKEKKSNDN